MALCKPFSPKQLSNLKKDLQTTSIPVDAVSLIIGYLPSFSTFAADIVTHFKFVPWRVVDEKEREAYQIGICVHPLFVQHKGLYEGYQGEIRFSRAGFVYMHGIPPSTLVESSHDLVVGSRYAFLNCEWLDLDQMDAISNGLQENTWASDKESALQRFFKGDEVAMCMGAVAAGMRLVWDFYEIPKSLMEDAVTCLKGGKTLDEATDSQEYPMMELTIMGALLKNPESYKNISYVCAKNPTQLQVLWDTVKRLGCPALTKQFVKYIWYGLKKGKLEPSDLTEEIAGAFSRAQPKFSFEPWVIEDRTVSPAPWPTVSSAPLEAVSSAPLEAAPSAPLEAVVVTEDEAETDPLPLVFTRPHLLEALIKFDIETAAPRSHVEQPNSKKQRL